MNCPKCDALMEPVIFNELTIERCTSCKGIWFPEAEHKELKAMPGSEVIDIGSAKEGKKNDSIRSIPCPVCEIIMDGVDDTFQPHIHYESCPRGHGVYFDAGEYKDFKEESISDFFKSLAMRFKNKKH